MRNGTVIMASHTSGLHDIKKQNLKAFHKTPCKSLSHRTQVKAFQGMDSGIIAK